MFACLKGEQGLRSESGQLRFRSVGVPKKERPGFILGRSQNYFPLRSSNSTFGASFYLKLATRFCPGKPKPISGNSHASPSAYRHPCPAGSWSWFPFIAARHKVATSNIQWPSAYVGLPNHLAPHIWYSARLQVLGLSDQPCPHDRKTERPQSSLRLKGRLCFALLAANRQGLGLPS